MYFGSQHPIGILSVPEEDILWQITSATDRKSKVPYQEPYIRISLSKFSSTPIQTVSQKEYHASSSFQ